MTELATRDLTWARKITERLRLQATNYAEAREKVIATLIEARDGGASALLGYASWTAYMADVFGDAPLRLERDARQELVAELAAEGMSTRAIAPIVGVSHTAVRKDLDAGGNKFPGDPEMRRVVEVITADAATGEVIDPPKITGMDGKQYSRPEPKKPNRRALADVANDAGWELRKAVERVARIVEDDRLRDNKEKVTDMLIGHLQYAVETCQGIEDRLTK